MGYYKLKKPTYPLLTFCLAMFSSPLVYAAGSSGIDLNLGTKADAGGRAGAAYTRAAGPGSALFGNPATLTQLKGVQASVGASYINFDLDHTTEYAGFTSETNSRHHDYITPDMAISAAILPRLTIAAGIEVDAGLGTDFRETPIKPLAGAEAALGFSEPFAIGLLVEVLSFNANIGAGYQVNDKLSVGAAVTIGFGLAQLGTAGDTTGFGALDVVAGIALGTPPGTFSDFGGTTSSVHDFGFGGSLGCYLST